MYSLYNRLEDLHQKYFDEVFFMDFARSHPALLYPATMLQIRLRERVVNVKFWEGHLKKREEKYKGKLVPVRKIVKNVRSFENIEEDHGLTSMLWVVCVYIYVCVCLCLCVYTDCLTQWVNHS